MEYAHSVVISGVAGTDAAGASVRVRHRSNANVEGARDMAEIVVTYTRDGDVHRMDTGGRALGTVVVDNTGIPQDARGGTAKQLLAASALYCYCGSLASALETRGVQYHRIEARADLETGNNDKGQGRVRKIAISAKVTLDGEDEGTFQRVERIMRGGCLVTGSLHEGIEMTYDLQAIYEDE
jgi:osmotically inducible protein OsmC